ncbi:hypothetical protein [Intrasporangium sp. YIM S08009]|uniref:hypothetical protein n=1 Tax=Intrasporangium zincisolvens TaxID=3080018 RepID=UPI002B05FF7C|nr:hypothetical protein [Intrasporangium sp. YIM S08009]
MPSRLRFVLSQLGSKPGGKDALSSLVDAASLPGAGWAVLDERTWRTGRQKPAEPWAQRAAAAGSITAWRSYRSEGRSLWLQRVPTVGPDDARAALAAIPTALLANLRSTVRLDSEADVEPPDVAGADAAWAHEQHTSGHPDAGTALLLCWTSGDQLFALGAAGRPEWTWTEVAALAEAQNAW